MQSKKADHLKTVAGNIAGTITVFLTLALVTDALVIVAHGLLKQSKMVKINYLARK